MNHLVQHWWPVQPARFECFVKRSRGGNHGSSYGPYQFSYRIQIMETPKDPGLWQYAAELPLSSPGRAARTSFCPLSQQYCNETMFFWSLRIRQICQQNLLAWQRPTGQVEGLFDQAPEVTLSELNKLLTPKQQTLLQSVLRWQKETKEDVLKILSNCSTAQPLPQNLCRFSWCVTRPKYCNLQCLCAFRTEKHGETMSCNVLKIAYIYAFC